jgi:hypothetical protein
MDYSLASTGMSYKEPLTTATSFGIMKPGPGLTVTDGVVDVTPVALFNQAYFYSTVTQTNPVANAVNIVTFNNAAVNIGITLVAGSQITVSRTANYVFAFTIQADKTDAGDDLMDVWLVRNGVNYPDTNSQSVVTGAVGVLALSPNYTLALTAGDTIQIAWQSSDTALRFLTVPVQVGPVRPVTPSVRCTIIQL